MARAECVRFIHSSYSGLVAGSSVRMAATAFNSHDATRRPKEASYWTSLFSTPVSLTTSSSTKLIKMALESSKRDGEA